MLTTEPTEEMISEWKRIFEIYKDRLTPNRKSGKKVDEYFRKKYHFAPFEDEKYTRMVERNILENDCSLRKLGGSSPEVKTYFSDGIFVGIDLVSGEFHVECEDIGRAVPIHDDLFVFRGLDHEDIRNFFLAAEYITLTNQ